MIKECGYCKKKLVITKEKYILLGTYDGKKTIQEVYYHLQCFRLFFEEKTREKAKNIVNHMANKVLPIAKKLAEKIVN